MGGSAYTVNEVEQVIITQFGEPVGDPVTTPGLKLKVPFIQNESAARTLGILNSAQAASALDHPTAVCWASG